MVPRRRGADNLDARETASCVAIIPTEPAAPRMSKVSPREIPSCFKMPTAASADGVGRQHRSS